MEVAEDYFRTLFQDLAGRTLTPRTDKTPDTVVDNVAFFNYTKLPGITCDRFFNFLKRSTNKKLGYVTEDEFIKGFLTVYLSSLQDKMLMTFKM